MDDVETLLVSHDGLGLGEKVATGEVSASELLDASVARIERLDPQINAVVHRLFNQARAALPNVPSGPLLVFPFC